MLNKYLVVAVACLSLAGCKGDFDGSYAGDNGMGTYAVMTVNGNSARIESIGRMRGDIKWADDFDAGKAGSFKRPCCFRLWSGRR